MNAYYLARNGQGVIKGFVAIGMNATPVFSDLVGLESVKVPVLDLFGSDDLPVVLENRLKRRWQRNLAEISGFNSRKSRARITSLMIKTTNWLTRSMTG